MNHKENSTGNRIHVVLKMKTAFAEKIVFILIILSSAFRDYLMNVTV